MRVWTWTFLTSSKSGQVVCPRPAASSTKVHLDLIFLGNLRVISSRPSGRRLTEQAYHRTLVVPWALVHLLSTINGMLTIWSPQCEKHMYLQVTFYPILAISPLCFLLLSRSVTSGFHVTLLCLLLWLCQSLEHFLNLLRVCFPAIAISLAKTISKIL